MFILLIEKLVFVCCYLLLIKFTYDERTEYVSECWSKDDEYTVLDDVPECETVTEQKCHEELVRRKFTNIYSVKTRNIWNMKMTLIINLLLYYLHPIPQIFFFSLLTQAWGLLQYFLKCNNVYISKVGYSTMEKCI